ncbi:MAG: hypothetical protein LCH93_06875 [Proteobacteria bacterium]|nr:hypothetical protein [Pseudomonadota bacterium]
MAIPTLSGSVELNDKTIDAVITEGGAGVYILGPNGVKGGVYVRLVGRSDVNLRARLKQHVGRHSHFVYSYADSPLAAFQAECRLYHYYDPSENAGHPVRPRNADWRCPGCALFDEPRRFSEEQAGF